MLPHEIPNLHSKLRAALQSPAVDRSKVVLELLYSDPIDRHSLRQGLYDKSGYLPGAKVAETVGKVFRPVFGPVNDFLFGWTPSWGTYEPDSLQWGTIVTQTQVLQVKTQGENLARPTGAKAETYSISKIDDFSITDCGKGWFEIDVNLIDRKHIYLIARAPKHNQAVRALKEQKALLKQVRRNSNTQPRIENIADQLEKLSELHRNQVITDDEYEAAKKRLLSK